MNKPKVLLLDCETAPIIAHVWGLFDQNIGLNQIVKDWHLLSWAAKWLDSPKVMYQDQRKVKKIEDDRALCEGIWKLLDEADVIITQNGKKFDAKKLNARFVFHGMKPPSPYKHIDTLQIAKKRFGFSSNKLAHMADILCAKYKKLDHKRFPGHEMWTECLAGNLAAWKEMEKYNKHDVLSLEELYHKLAPWDTTVNFNLYHDGTETRCNCGNTKLQARGFGYSAKGKYQRYQCTACGAWSKDSTNLFDKEKRKSLKTSAG